MRQARVDYDAIADLYDSTPYRMKPVDPELLAFVGADPLPMKDRSVRRHGIAVLRAEPH